MGARAYVLLDIANGKSEQVAKALQGKPGVMMADLLEGPRCNRGVRSVRTADAGGTDYPSPYLGGNRNQECALTADSR
jgi:hypothetical protein